MIAMLNGHNGVSKRMALAVLALVIFNYIILNKLHPGGLMAYVLPSACWGFLALVALKACGFKRIKSWFNSHVSIAAASVAIFYVIILVNIGLFMGFGRSALSFTPRGLIINLTLVLTTILGMEFSRAYLVKSFGGRRPFLTIGLVTLLYSFISISVFRLLALNDPLGVTKFLGVGLLPIIAENLLATYLALIGGPVASLAYRGPIMAFWWFCPILPHLSWGVEALLGVMVPTVGFFVINQFTSPMALRRSGIPAEVKGFGARRKGSPLRSWMVVSIACVLMVWTTTGLLGIQPTAVLSGSMRPTMDVGDMAIVRDVSTDSIEVGDVIQYWDDGEMVIHRVVEVSDGGKLFVTQGDANGAPDAEPVHPGQVKGEVILTIPELGWLPIGVKALAVGAWSFVSANPMVMVLITSFGVCVFYLYRTRSSGGWRAPKWKRKARIGGKIVPLLALLLVGTAASGLAYSCWSDSIYLSGTVTTGSWGAEKTFRLTVHHCVNLGNVTYYGAVKPDGNWRSVELTLEGYGHCKDKIYTGTLSDLPPGTHEWKIYYVDNLGENHLITSGTENLSDSVTNEYTLGPTSLCVCKTVKCGHAKHEDGYIYSIEGKIIVWNLDWYPAIVVDVSDTIEYKLLGSWWWESLTPISFDHNVPEVIPWGYHVYTYTCRFSTENILPLGGNGPLCKPSWRNLIEITISNAPGGMRTFHYRVGFELWDK